MHRSYNHNHQVITIPVSLLNSTLSLNFMLGLRVWGWGLGVEINFGGRVMARPTVGRQKILIHYLMVTISQADLKHFRPPSCCCGFWNQNISVQWLATGWTTKTRFAAGRGLLLLLLLLPISSFGYLSSLSLSRRNSVGLYDNTLMVINWK
jgi:hypothetical protein